MQLRTEVHPCVVRVAALMGQDDRLFGLLTDRVPESWKHLIVPNRDMTVAVKSGGGGLNLSLLLQ